MPPHSVSVSGTFKNYNTIEEFKAADKTALFNQAADEVCMYTFVAHKPKYIEYGSSISNQIWSSIEKGSTSSLTRFTLITFADLKKYKYYYWFAFPAFVAKPAWEVDGDWVAASTHFSNEAVSNTTTNLSSPFY